MKTIVKMDKNLGVYMDKKIQKEVKDKYYTSFNKFKILLTSIINVILIASISVVSILFVENRHIDVESIAFQETYMEIEKDNEDNVILTFPAIIGPSNASNKAITYSSSDTKIATVTEEGMITFYDFGTVVITAKSEENPNLSAECTFLVTDDQVHNVSILNPQYDITIGESFVLETKIIPNEAIDKSITYTSSNSSAVTIDGNGRVVAVGGGQATIIATSSNGVSDSFAINVFVPTVDEVISVVGNNQNIELVYLDKFYLTFETFDFDNVSYSDYDTDILQYDESSQIFVVIKGGTTSLTVNGDGTIFIINIQVFREVEDFEVTTQDIVLSENIGTTAKTQIQFTSFNFIPLDCSTKTATYSVDNEDIATVSSDGLLTFKQSGTIVLSVCADNVVKTFTITSTYGIPINFDVAIERYIFEDINLDFQIELINFLPLDYQFDISHVSFVSGDDSICSVNNQGVITSIAKGNTTIIVSAGTITKEIAIEVKVKTTSVAFIYNSQEINDGNIAGNTIQLGSKVLPSNANNQSVNYEVVYGDASIDESGLLVFSKAGAAVIRVTTLDSGVYNDITITKLNDNSILRIYNNDYDNLENHTFTIQANESLTPAVSLMCREDIINKDIYNLDNITIEYENENNLIVSPSSINNGEYVFTRTFSQQKKSNSTIIFNLNGIKINFSCLFLNLLDLRLEYNNAEDINYGPEQKRVFGTSSYINGNYVNYVLIPVVRNPINNEDDIHYFIENNEVAYVENGHLIVRNANLENELKVKVSVGDQVSKDDCRYLTSYEFTLISGCNIYDTNGYDYCVTNSTDRSTAIPMVFQANLGTQQEKNERPNQAFDSFTSSNWNIYSPVIGNGYILNFNYNATEKNGPIFHGDMRNLYVRGRDKYTDNSLYYLDVSIATITVEYCDFRYIGKVWIGNYTDNLVGENGAYEALIKNTYIGYCRSNAIHLEQNNYNLYLENIVANNVGMAAIYYGKGTLYIKGFCDIKNFVKADDYPTSLKLSGISIPINPQNLINDAISGVKSTYGDFVDSDENGKEVLNLAIVNYGLSEPALNTAYFYDEASGTYLAVGKTSGDTDNATGLNYSYLNYKYTTKVMGFIPVSFYINAWGIRVEDFDYDTEVNPNKIFRLYE